MSTAKRYTINDLHDPWVHYYAYQERLDGPVPFPSARNEREIERAARSILAGRSPGVEGWLAKRIAELARMKVARDCAERDVADLKAAIEARIVRIRLTEGDDAE